MNHILKDLNVPGPISTQISLPFWTAAHEGKLKLQRCTSCLDWVFYPRQICPHCWNTKLEWQGSCGRGKVKTFSVVYKPGHPAWKVVAPYVVALIQLEEGPTMLSLIVGTKPNRVQVGMPVQLRVVEIGEHSLPCFEPQELLEDHCD